MPTIHEVAKAAGVSLATVSRSFSDSSELSEETRLRVLEVARRLNYRPPHARVKKRRVRLARGGETTGAIGFQFFAPSDEATVYADAFYAPMLAGAQAEAQEIGWNLLVHTTSRYALSSELPLMVRDQAIAGMLLVGTADPAILTTFLEHVPQIVLVDNRDATGQHDCILSEGIGGAAEATNYLFKLGHRRVGFVLSEPQTPTFQDRLTGYLSAHFRAGLTADRSLVVTAGSKEDFLTQVQELLKRPDRPTAIIAANDPHAYLVMQACYNRDLQIPADLSLIGFDDDRYSSLSLPQLTTMRVDTAYMGRLGVRRLLARLEESDKRNLDGSVHRPNPPVNIEVPVRLVERQSCRAL